MQMNSKDHLESASDQIMGASLSLSEALCNVEKNNNKQQLQRTLEAVEKAILAASSALDNYQD